MGSVRVFHCRLVTLLGIATVVLWTIPAGFHDFGPEARRVYALALNVRQWTVLAQTVRSASLPAPGRQVRGTACGTPV